MALSNALWSSHFDAVRPDLDSDVDVTAEGMRAILRHLKPSPTANHSRA
ncbi:hypothetical protein FB390_1953 [Nocardia bhagyanarayanae]|uniref:Uncharacterized protein n=1 Tax=Nocardia bhagyanarayanae TaxID=1215925 RepID=A0A543F989_9NOCA|nr:hypothetical protein FB390_1953 [Nocardia bhagyanarayanae]